MSQPSAIERNVARSVAKTLVRLRTEARRTQSQVASRMQTTQTAIARLESGRQSPSLSTLLAYARANDYCLELGFVPHSEGDDTGCVIRVDTSACK